MAVEWRYTPPKLSAIPLVRAATQAAVEAAAQHLLDASRPLVPVESGRLRDSGHVTPQGVDGELAAAAVGYGIEDDTEVIGFRDDIAVGSSPTAAYAKVQHEDLSFHHEQGQAKYLEQPMHAEHDAMRALVIAELHKVGE